MRDCIPASWREVTIGDIALYVQRGKSPKYIEHSDLPVINQKCIRWHGVDPQWLKFVHPNQWDSWADERFLRDGDVLWNSTGTGTIGRATVFRRRANCDRAVVDSHVTIVRCGEYSSKLLHYWIMSPFVQSKIEGMQAGSTNQVELSKKEVLATRVLVPPIPEQHRIVEAIESYLARLDDAVASLERVQRNLERYRASVLKSAVEGRLVPTEAALAREENRAYEPANELLERILTERKTRWIEEAAEKVRAKAEAKALKAGKPSTPEEDAVALAKARKTAEAKYKDPKVPDTTDLPTLPEGWSWTTIGHFADHRLGKMLDKAKNEGAPRDYLRNTNVRWFGFDMHDVAQMRVTDKELPSVSVIHGDLVVCEGGEPGRCSVWEGHDPIAIQKALHRVRVHRSIESWFVAYQLGADALSHRLEREFTGTTIKHFTGEAFRSHPFAIPPANEQTRIVGAIRASLSVVEHISQQIERGIMQSKSLRQSILRWAFEGKLVEQDPNDEPASALLERIKTERSGAGR